MVDNNVLISLGDSRMKKVAEVLSSKSAVRILDLLSEEVLTVSEISEKLGMKLNTTDYNVKKLVDAGLIEKADHWWSVKGRKMISYKAANRQIIISPKEKVGSKFFWVLGLTGLVGLFIRQRMLYSTNENVVFMQDAVLEAAPKAGSLAVELSRATMDAGFQEIGFFASLASWEWFLIGAWSAIVLFFVWSMIVERRR